MITNTQTLKAKTETLNDNKQTKTTNETILLENNRILKKILRHYQWQTAFSVLKIIIILVPLVFAYMYLPSILSEILGQYNETMNAVGGINSELQNVKNSNILDQIKEAQKLLK